MRPANHHRAHSGRTTPIAVLVVALSLVASGSAGAAATSASSGARVADSGSAFCQTMAALNQDSRATSSGSSSPAELRSAYGKFKSIEAKLLSLSPSAIKGDMQKDVATIKLFFSDLATVNYDSATLSPAVGAELVKDDAAATPAFKAVDAFVKKACGITLPTG